MRNSPSGKCCPGCDPLPLGDKVLCWDTNCSFAVPGLTKVKDVFAANSITAHLSAAYTGVLADYRLIIWCMGESDPSWLATVFAGTTWKGRIHITGEYGNNGLGNPGWKTPVLDYLNSILNSKGVIFNDDFVADGGTACGSFSGILTGHSLTTGMTEMSMEDSCSLSIGTGWVPVVTTHPTLPQIVFAQRKINCVDYVVAGDSSHIADHCPGEAAINAQFLLNMYNNAI